MSKLVIVESPAKAKTISRFLGKGYEVLASFGHVRDLPQSASDIPAEFKKLKWAKLGVNTDSEFEPLYIIPDDKKRHVDSLKKAAKGVDEVLLATDEDREGESISWHILQVVKPKKTTKVRRIVFHEVTPEAINEALRHPRDIDESLVKAQETRRILDRLYGYSLSPLLWKKVAPKLSAGRVQSVAVRLTVMRERERMQFVKSEYWDLSANFRVEAGAFDAKLIRVDNQKIASGQSFDSTSGKLKDKSLLIDQALCQTLLQAAKEGNPYKVLKIEAKPGLENPPKPFQTSTLQQEANRKLRFSSKRTMQIAQNLYEGIDLGGERVGLITYMRTDSLTLSTNALKQARDVIVDLYGREYLPDKPVQYRTKAKNAQEAHEAIRPTDLSKRPQDVQRYLTDEQFKLYELIWKRTIACQMLPAQVLRSTVEVGTKSDGRDLVFSASGRQITFPGFLRAYVEGSDDPEAELDQRESILPPLKEGQSAELRDAKSLQHFTMPPARYTEASLVGKLESESVGRPSTYASIISTIQDRGYVFKRGNELVPTFTAFAVTELLENNFEELVDIEFTAKMEDQLDDIADGKRDATQHLKAFYRGVDGNPGLIEQIDEKTPNIPFPALKIGEDPNSNDPIVVKVGRTGAYLQRGEGGQGNTASLDPELPPADLTLDSAVAMLAGAADGPQSIGTVPNSGKQVFLKKGRFGPYLEIEQTEEEQARGDKPQRVSLPPGMKADQVSEEDVPLLVLFPRDLGEFPDTGAPMTIAIGRFGPYLKVGDEFRNIPDWREAAKLSVADAIELFRTPKATRGGSRTPAAAIQEFGKLEGAAGNVRVLSGRYGPYVTDGKTNATLPKGTAPESISADDALKLLLAKASAGPTKTKRVIRRGKSRVK